MANEPVKTEETNEETTSQEQTPDLSELEARIKQLEAENGKLRQANTNASADASKWKKQYQEKLSEEERTQAQKAEAEENLRKELESLKAERNVASYKSQLMAPAIGFDEELAAEVASALNAQDNAKVFDGLRRFITAHDKQLRENAFRANPVLSGGTAPKNITKEQFDSMGYKERVEVAEKYPDLYAEYTS